MSLQNGNDLEDNNMKRSLTKESVSQKGKFVHQVFCLNFLLR